LIFLAQRHIGGNVTTGGLGATYDVTSGKPGMAIAYTAPSRRWPSAAEGHPDCGARHYRAPPDHTLTQASKAGPGVWVSWRFELSMSDASPGRNHMYLCNLGSLVRRTQGSSQLWRRPQVWPIVAENEFCLWRLFYPGRLTDSFKGFVVYFGRGTCSVSSSHR